MLEWSYHVPYNVRHLSLLELSGIPGTVFQLVYHSSLQMACTCSWTRRGYAVILLLELAINFTVHLLTADISKPTASARSFGPRRRVSCRVLPLWAYSMLATFVLHGKQLRVAFVRQREQTGSRRCDI